MSKNKKAFYEMTPKERAEAAKLTPEEKEAVDALIKAVKNLPKTICIAVDQYDDATLRVRKRITSHSAVSVATLHKPSIYF
jgi:hypothetical protein